MSCATSLNKGSEHMKEIVLLVVFKAKPGKEAALSALLHQMSVLSLAETGCRAYTLHVDADDPTTLVLYEVWDDQAALDAHDQSAHVAHFIGAFPALVAGPMDRKVLVRLT
jgi:quinol monooxygenase YgiN